LHDDGACRTVECHRRIALQRLSAFVAVFILLAAPGTVLAKTCLFTDASFLPSSLCLTDDDEIDLQSYARARGQKFYPVDRLLMARGDVLYLSDKPRLAGRIWRIGRSLDLSEISALGIAPYSTASARLAPVVCLLEGHRFGGAKMCMQPGTVQPTLGKLESRVASIRVPSGLGVRVYTEAGGRGRGTFIRRNQNLPDLQRLGLASSIRAAQVARINIRCHAECPIVESDAYDLPTLFGDGWWNLAGGHPQFAVTLRADANSRAVIEFGEMLYLQLMESEAMVTTFWPYRQHALLPIRPDVRHITIAFEFRPPGSFDVQIVRSDEQRRFIDASAIVTLPWPVRRSEILSIRNARPTQALVQTLLSLQTAAPDARVARGTPCNSDPLLGVGHAFLSGCHGSGSAFPAQIPKPPTAFSYDTVLVRTFANAGNPLAAGAAARVCHVPLEQLYGRRPMRVVADWSACVSRTTLIVTLYQTLFADRWNLGDFTDIVTDALHQGITPGVGDTELARQFVLAVQEQVGGVDRRLDDAIAAFHQANVIHAYSRARAQDMELAIERAEQAGPHGCTRGIPLADSVSGLRGGTMGWYQVDIADYVPRTIIPRLWRDGALHNMHESFTYMAAGADTPDLMLAIRNLMQDWGNTYLLAFEAASAQVASEPETGEPRGAVGGQPLAAPPTTPCTLTDPASVQLLAMSGNSIAMGIAEATRFPTRADHFVVVSFRGHPVAVLQGVVPTDGSRTAESRFVVSAPLNVLERYADGALRGAGSAATHAFIQYALSRSMTSVRALAVTEPSVTIKHRVGFRLID